MNCNPFLIDYYQNLLGHTTKIQYNRLLSMELRCREVSKTSQKKNGKFSLLRGYLLIILPTSCAKYNSADKKNSSTVPKLKTLLNGAESLNKIQHIKCGNQKLNGELLQF